MEILVTGCAGFFGAALSRRLLQRGNEVTGVDNLNDYYGPGLKRDRLVEEFDFAPRVPLEQGIKQLVDWYKSYYMVE